MIYPVIRLWVIPLLLSPSSETVKKTIRKPGWDDRYVCLQEQFKAKWIALTLTFCGAAKVSAAENLEFIAQEQENHSFSFGSFWTRVIYEGIF